MTTLWHIARAAARDLQDHLAMIGDPRTDALTMQVAVRKFAVIGLCHLLYRGSRAGLDAWLSMGAQAFAHWQARADEGAKVTAPAEAFTHALVAGDALSAAAIHRTARTTCHRGREYPEDFAWARIRQLLAMEPHPEPAVRALLEVWQGVSGGGEAEFHLAHALLARDAAEARRWLDVRLAARLQQTRRRQREAIGDAQEGLTLGQVDLETVSLIRVARERLGMDLLPVHRLLPAELSAPAGGQPVPPEAWRDGSRYDAIHHPW